MLLKKILTRVLAKKVGKVQGKNIKTIRLFTYIVELASTYLLDLKKRGK